MAEEIKDRKYYLDRATGNGHDAYLFDWSTIPSEFVDEDFVCKAISSHAGVFKNIPTIYITQKAVDTLARGIFITSDFQKYLPPAYNTVRSWAYYASAHTDVLGEIPKQFLNQEFYNIITKNNSSFVKLTPEQYQTQEMWNNYIKEDSFVVSEGNYDFSKFGIVPERFQTQKLYEALAESGNMQYVPKEYQTQEMWEKQRHDSPQMPLEYIKPENNREEQLLNAKFEVLEQAKRNPRSIPRIDRELQSQDLWDLFVETYPDDVDLVPDMFQTQEMWNRFAKERPSRVRDVPDMFQTQEMWTSFAENILGSTKYIPLHFRTGEIWEKYIEEYPHEFDYVPKRFLTAERCIKFIRSGARPKLYDIPPEIITTELLETIVYYMPSTTVEIFRKNELKNLVSQKICDKYIEQQNLSVSTIKTLPERFQTQEMWENLFRDHLYKSDLIYILRDIPDQHQTHSMWTQFFESNLRKADYILFSDMPIRFQTQKMWNYVAENFDLTEDDLKHVPEEFYKGVKEIYDAKHKSNDQTSVENNHEEVVPTPREGTHTENATENKTPTTVETQPEIKPEVKTEVKTEVKPEVKPEIQAENDNSSIFVESSQSKQMKRVINNKCEEFIRSSKDILDFINSAKQDKRTQQAKDMLVKNTQRIIDYCKQAVEIPELDKQKYNSTLTQFYHDSTAFTKFRLNVLTKLSNTQYFTRAQLQAIKAKYGINIPELNESEAKPTKKEDPASKGKPASPEKKTSETQLPLRDEPATVTKPTVAEKQNTNGGPIIDSSVKKSAVENPTIIAPIIEGSPIIVEQPTTTSTEKKVTSVAVPEKSEFETVLEKFSQVHSSYYDGVKGTKGHAHSKAEIALKNSINKKMKKYLSQQMEKEATENSVDQGSLVEQLSNAVSPNLIEEVSKNKGATLQLMEIMASGVYVQNGEKIKLTQKQRIALAHTMAKVSEKLVLKEAEPLFRTTNQHAAENVMNAEVEME